MKNTIDLPSLILRRRGTLLRFCQNVAFRTTAPKLICKNVAYNTQIKAKVRLLSTLNYWDSRFPLFIVKLKGLRSKKGERKIGSGNKCALSSS
jgi:hypothetical protein